MQLGAAVPQVLFVTELPVHTIETINKMKRISRQIPQETGSEPDRDPARTLGNAELEQFSSRSRSWRIVPGMTRWCCAD